MEIAYKLTVDMETRNNCKWVLGKKNVIEKEGKELCTDQVFHAYRSPLLAVLLNPIHADYDNPTLLKIECDIVADDGLKIGSKWQRPIKIMELPVISEVQKIRFAILCEKQVRYLRDPIPEYDSWADKFLIDGVIDRSAASAAGESSAAASAATRAVSVASVVWAASVVNTKIDFVKLAEEACA